MHANLTSAHWIKSRHSGGGGNCIEVAPNLPHVVPVRDSKDPSGPALLLSPTAFAAFVASVKYGDLGTS